MQDKLYAVLLSLGIRKEFFPILYGVLLAVKNDQNTDKYLAK